jgi:hypothetical protein
VATRSIILPSAAELERARRTLQGGVEVTLHTAYLIRRAAEVVHEEGGMATHEEVTWEAIGRLWEWHRNARARLDEMSHNLHSFLGDVNLLTDAIPTSEGVES